MARARAPFRPVEPAPWAEPRKASRSRARSAGVPRPPSAAPPPAAVARQAGVCVECGLPDGPWLDVHAIAAHTSFTPNKVRWYHRTRSTCGFPSRKVGGHGLIMARRCCVDAWLERGGVPAC